MAHRSRYEGFAMLDSLENMQAQIAGIKIDHETQAKVTFYALIASNCVFALILWICGLIWGTIMQYIVFSTLFIGNIIFLPLPWVFLVLTHVLPFVLSLMVFLMGKRIESSEFLGVLFVWVVLVACEVGVRLLDRQYLVELAELDEEEKEGDDKTK